MAGWELTDPNNCIPTFSFLLPGSFRFLQTVVLLFSKLFWDNKKTHLEVSDVFCSFSINLGLCEVDNKSRISLAASHVLRQPGFSSVSALSASQYCFSVLLLSTASQRYFSTFQFQFSVLLFRTQRFSALFLNLVVCAGHGHGLGINLSAIMWNTLANLYVCHTVTSLLPKVSSGWCDTITLW